MKDYRWLAWGAFAIVALLSIGALGVMRVLLSGQTDLLDDTLPAIFNVLSGLTSAVIGTILVTKRPQNAIGWLLLGAGFALAIESFLNNYAQTAFWAGSEGLPGGLIAVWLTTWWWVLPILGAILILHLFPTGRFLSRRWKRTAIASVILAAGSIPLFAFATPIDMTGSTGTFKLANPVGLYTLGNPEFGIVFIVIVLPIIASLVSMLLRFGRARGIEREQMKWLLYAASLFVCSIILSIISSNPIFALLTNFFGLGLSIAVGIAILRYRLFDIDILIRRTLTYSLVTVLLLLVYFASVVLLQLLLSVVTGLQHNEIVTVLSTLAIAALFVPLRNRVQGVIDRRFNRNKYDAQKILEHFAVTVRDETDLEKLTGSLVQVVNETMQPKSVGLWLLTDQRRKTVDG